MFTIRRLAQLAASTTLAASLAFGASALDISALNDDERTAFRAEIRAYLMENPEVLMEAVDVYNQRIAAAQEANESDILAAHADAIFNNENDLVYGNPDGDVVFVEFLDYRCGYCKKAHPEVMSLLKQDGNIKLIVKEYPVLGEESLLASRFALAVKATNGMEAYGRVHDALMETRKGVTEGMLKRIAKDLDLDADAVFDAIDDPSVVATLTANQEIGQALQITGTPTFIMNTEMVRGYVPFDSMVEIVAELRAAN